MKLIMENWKRYLLAETSFEQDGKIMFIVRSNQIEGYDTPEEEVKEAIEGLEQGYPLRYVTQNPHIYSHLAGLEAAESGHSSVADILKIHRAMGSGALESGAPGMLRVGGAESEHGTKYTQPEDVPAALEWWTQQDWQDPFEAHTIYELIHPFDDGNGRSGRIILAAMLDFNFDRTNSYIGSDYFISLDKASAGHPFFNTPWAAH